MVQSVGVFIHSLKIIDVLCIKIFLRMFLLRMFLTKFYLPFSENSADDGRKKQHLAAACLSINLKLLLKMETVGLIFHRFTSFRKVKICLFSQSKMFTSN